MNIIFAIIVIGIAIGWSWFEFKGSHENFYYSVSYKIKQMVEDVRKTVNGRDTQSLIEIMFFSLEEHILYILRHHKFLRKKNLTDQDFARYNNLFYMYLAGIYAEWYINNVDLRLVNLFMTQHGQNIKTHMNETKYVMLDRNIKAKVRRKTIVNSYINMLMKIKTDYINAFDMYQNVLNGIVSYDELIERSIYTHDEFGILVNGIVERRIITEEEDGNKSIHDIIT